MRKNKLLLLLALLMTAATGAWADETLLLTIESRDYKSFKSGSKTFDDKVTVTFSNSVQNDGDNWGWYANSTAPLLTVAGINGYTITSCKFYVEISGTAMTGYTVEGESPSVYLSNLNVYTDNSQSVKIGKNGITKIEVFTAAAPAGFTVSLKDGVKDADKWTISPNPAPAGSPVTIQYTGRLKVKGVKATSDDKPAAPSVTEVTTFSELQTALSAGKNVKLMNDIVCTSETEINSNGAFIEITKGALTIDGNGKKLSTTSEIRAFKVGTSATVAFKDLTLTGFVSGGGPAINNSGTIVLDGCTISNCHVNNTNGGGAIENKSSGKLYAINTTFSGNYSGEIGGAINNYRGSLYMSVCTFTNNYTTKSNAYWGGAIGINGGNEIRLINCSFSGNQYGTNAGPSDIGVYSNPTNYTIAGCTGATIASNNGDITTNASGTATLDYSDLSNISFTVEPSAPAGSGSDIPNSDPYTPGGDPFSF